MVLPLAYTLVVNQVNYLLNNGEDHTEGHHDNLGAQTRVVAVTASEHQNQPRQSSREYSQGNITASVVLSPHHKARYSAHNPHSNGDASFSRFATVELYPAVVDGMVSDGEGVDEGPQTPPRPLSDVRMDLSSDYQGDNIADVGEDDREAALVGLVTEVGEDEDDHQRQRGADGSKGISCDTVKTKCHDNRGRVRGERRPGREHGKGGHVVRPATPVCHGLPDEGPGDLEALSSVLPVPVVDLEAALEDLLLAVGEADDAGAEPGAGDFRGPRQEEEEHEGDEDGEETLDYGTSC